MMTISEVSLTQPEVVAGYCVTCWFRHLRVSLKFFTWILSHHKSVLPWRGFSNFLTSSTQFCRCIREWECEMFTSFQTLKSNVRGVQVSTTQFCCLLPIPMAGVSDGTDVTISLAQASSSNMGSPDGSGSDLDGMGTRSGSTTDEMLDALFAKFVHFETQIAQIPALPKRMSRMDLHWGFCD